MTPITKFEEQVAYTPNTGVCVPRQRLFTARGWVYHVDTLGVAPLTAEPARRPLWGYTEWAHLP